MHKGHTGNEIPEDAICHKIFFLKMKVLFKVKYLFFCVLSQHGRT